MADMRRTIVILKVILEQIFDKYTLKLYFYKHLKIIT